MDLNQPIDSFDYFIGKVCSIHTQPNNWNLAQQQNIDYYVGVVNMVNDCGICITNVINHTKTFIMMPAIISISEEFVADRENPEHRAMLEEYEKKKAEIFQHNPRLLTPEEKTVSPPQAPNTVAPKGSCQPNIKSTYVDIESLTKQAQQARSTFEK